MSRAIAALAVLVLTWAPAAASLAIGAQNAFNTYPDESARAMSVGEKYSEYTPWGFNGAYYYVRVGYGWGN